MLHLFGRLIRWGDETLKHSGTVARTGFKCNLFFVSSIDCVEVRARSPLRQEEMGGDAVVPVHIAERAIEVIEALHMMRKGQVKMSGGKDAAGQAKFVASLFRVVA